MDKIVLNSFAKINFGLNIISKRTDGYHNIETIFYPVKLHDILTIEKSNSFHFQSNSEALTSETGNLIIKAKYLLERYLNKTFSIDINLQKNIPIGAGLGGGSSNAASTLMALNELFKINLAKEELFNIAVQLGSDTPFFLDTKPMFAEKRGEALQPTNFKINYPILIINPGIHVSTPWAYSKIIPKRPECSLNKIVEEGFKDFSELKGIIVNDFEKIVFEKFPEIKEIKNNLYKLGAQFALMTGSGSTVFGIFSNLEKTKKAEKVLSEKYFTFVHL